MTEAVYLAAAAPPLAVAVHISKHIQVATGTYTGPKNVQHRTYKPKVKGDIEKIRAAVDLMARAKRPVLYSGGGVINSGSEASPLLRELAKLTGSPITST